MCESNGPTLNMRTLKLLDHQMIIGTYAEVWTIQCQPREPVSNNPPKAWIFTFPQCKVNWYRLSPSEKGLKKDLRYIFMSTEADLFLIETRLSFKELWTYEFIWIWKVLQGLHFQLQSFKCDAYSATLGKIFFYYLYWPHSVLLHCTTASLYPCKI